MLGHKWENGVIVDQNDHLVEVIELLILILLILIFIIIRILLLE